MVGSGQFVTLEIFAPKLIFTIIDTSSIAPFGAGGSWEVVSGENYSELNLIYRIHESRLTSHENE